MGRLRKVRSLFADPDRLVFPLAFGVVLGALIRPLLFVSVGLWCLVVSGAIISVAILATGGYAHLSYYSRVSALVCGMIGVVAGLLLWDFQSVQLDRGDIAVHKDKVVIVGRPTRVVAFEPPASVKVEAPFEIMLLVSPVDKEKIAKSLTPGDRLELFRYPHSSKFRSQNAENLLSRALGREVARSAAGRSLDEALRANGLALYRAPSLGTRG